MTEETKEKKIGLFDFVGDIMTNKKYLFSEDTRSVYNNFMINRAMMQHQDTVLLANELNKRPDVSREMHHDFLFYAVSPKKRYGKWAKSDTSNEELLEYISKRYAVGSERALEYLSMMDEEDVAAIEKTLKSRAGRM